MLLGVFSPLWVPVVTVASVLFLPVGIGMVIRETLKAREQRMAYMADKAKFMSNWTDEIMGKVFTEENIKAFIDNSYFELFKISILQLCDEYIPKQIASDRRQVTNIANDQRTSQEIVSSFQPLQKGVREMLAKLKFFHLEYMAKDVIPAGCLQQQRLVGSGNFSNVYIATWNHDNVVHHVALKALKKKLSGVEMYTQLVEVETLR